MSLKIRLSRGGAKKRPYYRIVVADSRKARDGGFIERVGSYNPMVAKDHPNRVVLNEERIRYWIGVGGKPTDRVARFLARAGIMDAPKIPKQTKQHLPRAKTLERMKEGQEKATAAAEAAQAKEEAKAKEEAQAAPAEEKAEAKADEKAEEKVEEKAEEKAEEKVEEKVEEKTEEKAEEKTEEKTEDA